MLFCLAILVIAEAGPAYTKDRDQSLVTNEVTFSLISAVNATGYLTEIPLGLKVELKEG